MNSVLVDDWTAELAIIASNATFIRLQEKYPPSRQKTTSIERVRSCRKFISFLSLFQTFDNSDAVGTKQLVMPLPRKQPYNLIQKKIASCWQKHYKVTMDICTRQMCKFLLPKLHNGGSHIALKILNLSFEFVSFGTCATKF